ncbi:hypothetical protein JMUB7542_27870 [Staphylococcus aureus]
MYKRQVIDDTNAPIIIKILKSIGKLSKTSSTLKARNIKINAELLSLIHI